MSDTLKIEQSSNGRAADIIISALEQEILSGKLAYNTPLPAERELMTKFNASRTVVREAITALSNRGLLESKPRFRPIVKEPNYGTALDAVDSIVRHLLNNMNDVKHLYDTRIFIERGLVRDAAVKADKNAIKKIKTTLAANKEAIQNSDEFYRTDVAFHRVFYEISDNPILPIIHIGYVSWLAPQWECMLRSPERNFKNYQAHEHIVECILDRDPDAAENALITHLNAAWSHVSTTFESE